MPYLHAHHNGSNEWSIFDLVQILSRGSGSENNALFEQNPVTLRRKKSWATEQMLVKSIELDYPDKTSSHVKGKFLIT